MMICIYLRISTPIVACSAKNGILLTIPPPPMVLCNESPLPPKKERIEQLSKQEVCTLSTISLPIAIGGGGIAITIY